MSGSGSKRTEPSSTRVFSASKQDHSVLSLRTEANDAGTPLRATQCATRPLPGDADDHAAVVEAWDRLPEALPVGIVAMVKGAMGSGGSATEPWLKPDFSGL